MANLPTVPATLSTQGRARMIGDIVNRVEYVGKPDARRAAVEAAVEAHIIAAVAQSENTPPGAP